jgi:hypothetical protein
MGAADLNSELIMLSESPWRDLSLSTRKLSILLRDYGISSRSDGRLRCYHRADFEDAWERYLGIVSKPSKVSDSLADLQESTDTSTDTLESEVSVQTTTDTLDTEVSGKVSAQNPRSGHVSDTSDTSDTKPLPMSAGRPRTASISPRTKEWEMKITTGRVATATDSLNLILSPAEAYTVGSALVEYAEGA